jgi:glutathione synthase/RimK-type ligase-like ATP-grasp enzyme
MSLESTSTIQGQSRFPIDAVTAIWWRRPFASQVSTSLLSENDKRFIDEQCRAAYWGSLNALFRGKWISEPGATLRASNKIFQLSVARASGFRVPNTLISQCRSEVISFYDLCRQMVIVKSLVAPETPMLFTRPLSDPRLMDDGNFSICPTIYQEMIPGRRHLRLNCFGKTSIGVIIESDDLDWRSNMNVPVYPYMVPDDVLEKSALILQTLGLEMGIFDLKETPEGEWVWLEVNPQGQFLFLEPITNLPLSECFADFLIHAAVQ